MYLEIENKYNIEIKCSTLRFMVYYMVLKPS